jgi:hypothetical protein
MTAKAGSCWLAARGLSSHLPATELRPRWRLPQVKNNPAVKDLKQSLALLRALTPAQRADPKPQLGSVERAQAVEIAAREMPVRAV